VVFAKIADGVQRLEIPYATEQGISKAEQGILFADQGNFQGRAGKPIKVSTSCGLPFILAMWTI
jgi:hypothetical protein